MPQASGSCAPGRRPGGSARGGVLSQTEAEAGAPELDLVAFLQLGGAGALAVDLHPVGGLQVLDHVGVVGLFVEDERVLPG